LLIFPSRKPPVTNVSYGSGAEDGKLASPNAGTQNQCGLWSRRFRSTVALVRLVSPESEPEIMAIVAMLQGHGIPCYVRGGGFGGLYPGVQINAYNTRDIMIPEEQAAPALELLKEFQSRSPETHEDVKPAKSGRLRNLFELLFFGWFVPKPPDDTRKRDRTS
jgi:Putative prokaryotic signal transducing protein